MSHEPTYNLFLALGVAAGLIMIAVLGVPQGGFAVTIFALLSMVLAAVVLVTSNPKAARSSRARLRCSGWSS